MPKRVLLVGYEDQDNLGIRYLSSRLLQEGHHTRIAAFSGDPGPLLRTIAEERPDLVGFSLIFQYMVPDFAVLIHRLRAGGITAHFTIGGHYASFEPAEVFRQIPELDSVVRFEGEDTLADVVANLDEPSAWQKVPGIAWMNGKAVVCNPARTAKTSIDDFAEPDRRDIDYRAQALPTASVLASRGCPWHCSFCSIVTFYAANGTPGRRRRNPERVVDEVEALVRERGAKLILFQDDDFLAGGPAARAWASAVGEALVKRGLHREMRFKIACRSDEVREETLAPLVAAGLCHVYLGVESGDEANLIALGKHLTPKVHVRAGEILRKLDLSFDFGFMLLEPWSTMATARSNAHFVREFTKDGWAVAGFCRTLPYVGTPIEKRLRAEGRLVGAALDAEYKFLDEGVDLLWNFCLMAFEGRNFGKNATWNVLRGLLFDAHFDMPGRRRNRRWLGSARALVRASNELMLDVLDGAIDLIELIENGDGRTLDHPDLIELAKLARREDLRLRRQLADLGREYGVAAPPLPTATEAHCAGQSEQDPRCNVPPVSR